MSTIVKKEVEPNWLFSAPRKFAKTKKEPGGIRTTEKYPIYSVHNIFRKRTLSPELTTRGRSKLWKVVACSLLWVISYLRNAKNGIIYLTYDYQFSNKVITRIEKQSNFRVHSICGYKPYRISTTISSVLEDAFDVRISRCGWAGCFPVSSPDEAQMWVSYPWKTSKEETCPLLLEQKADFYIRICLGAPRWH
ncbi:hypothetical protein AVEN_95391-1 [Araneus ventricosus]|uniref:Uncharacterized protein n=1 Tax=Araneus ventricosus TaxID=182803 RepID=A0A4Y2CHS5_ARAVE|nr:hypothetical protein AVEN_95391-1 [Araneus ventricosus]